MPPSRIYRNYLRDIRMVLTPSEEDLLMGEPINNLRMCDLEALYELALGFHPIIRSPSNYRPRH